MTLTHRSCLSAAPSRPWRFLGLPRGRGYSDVDKYGDMMRAIGTRYVQGNGGSGKVRAAPKAKPAIVNAVHAFYHGEDLGTECPLVS